LDEKAYLFFIAGFEVQVLGEELQTLQGVFCF
jgi:hypothetical protein